MVQQNDFSQEGELNFTPYQAAHVGITKHSATLAQSNPLYTKAQEQREAKPSEIALSTKDVKKVWGSAPVQPVQEETKKEDHYVQGSIAKAVVPQKPIAAKKIEVKENKKQVKANALFAGINDQQDAKKDNSDESDDA